MDVNIKDIERLRRFPSYPTEPERWPECLKCGSQNVKWGLISNTVGRGSRWYLIRIFGTHTSGKVHDCKDNNDSDYKVTCQTASYYNYCKYTNETMRLGTCSSCAHGSNPDPDGMTIMCDKYDDEVYLKYL